MKKHFTSALAVLILILVSHNTQSAITLTCDTGATHYSVKFQWGAVDEQGHDGFALYMNMSWGHPVLGDDIWMDPINTNNLWDQIPQNNIELYQYHTRSPIPFYPQYLIPWRLVEGNLDLWTPIDTDQECSKFVNLGTSPLLIDLDRNGFHLSGGPVHFDINADSLLETLTWVSPNERDAFLFLDINSNGVVDNGAELFGNSRLLTSGEVAENGFLALAEYDLEVNGGDNDNVIDSSDLVFMHLRVWVDSNADGISDVTEVLDMDEARIAAIELNYSESRYTDPYGNEFKYIGHAWIEGKRKVNRTKTVDVFFKILSEGE